MVEQIQQRAMKMKVLEHRHTRKDRELGLLSLMKRGLRVDPMNMYRYLEEK